MARISARVAVLTVLPASSTTSTISSAGFTGVQGDFQVMMFRRRRGGDWSRFGISYELRARRAEGGRRRAEDGGRQREKPGRSHAPSVLVRSWKTTRRPYPCRHDQPPPGEL